MSLDVSSLLAMPSVFHLIRNILKGHGPCAEIGGEHASVDDTDTPQEPGIISLGEPLHLLAIV